MCWPGDGSILLTRSISHLTVFAGSNQLSNRLTYHVQVFQLTNATTTTMGVKGHDSVPNGVERKFEEQYSPHRDNSPEPGKRISSKQPPPPPIPPSNETSGVSKVMIMDTINFTNPLFIITNLTSSTSYLLRIWSSKSNLNSMVEQVNITVRTRPDDSLGFDGGLVGGFGGVRSSEGFTLLRLANERFVLLFALIALISIIFIILTITYGIFKIRAVLEIRKGMHQWEK